MRTSEEIYHRVRWDPRFDPSRYVLGVAQRGRDPKRIPLPAFTPGGDVPWHRVLFVEADGELVWDRVTGLDRVDTSDAGRVHEPLLLRPPFFTSRLPHAWNPATASWLPARTRALPPATSSLRVLTWNTLWDRYDGDRIDTARRRPLLLAALRQADADVIALQEVEPALLTMLLSTPWVRDRYAISTSPDSPDIDDHGLLLLTRLPVREAAVHPLGPHKALVALVVDTATGPLVIAATHLTSDHSTDGAVRRHAELAGIAEGLAGAGDVILLGDFNDGTGLPASALGLRDAWTEAHGPDDTPTFDPHVNPLAALASLSGRPSRLDRILLRGRPGVISAALRGHTPTPEGLYISDHYGVEATLDLTRSAGESSATGFAGVHTSVLNVPPTARTAVAWIPPEDLWPPIQEIRQRHDPRFDRWPPHVNLLFGFVQESEFDAAAPLLAAAAAEVTPFRTRLRGIRSFRHQSDSTVWLDPAGDGPDPWTRLYEALVGRFPGCRGRAEGFTPHLTLGRAKDPDRLGLRLDELTAEVGELVLLSRRAGEPMRPRAVLTLGTGELRWLPDHPPARTAEPRRRTALAERITRHLTEALRPGLVHLAGSRRMGCDLPVADLDLVAALPGELNMADVEARVRATLPDAVRVRQVIGARVPGLRFHVPLSPDAPDGMDVDVAVVGTGTLSPDRSVSHRAVLGQAAAVALGAISDADAIRAAVGPAHPAFVHLARQVKTWARARGLDSAPFGGLPGLAWTILAARTVREHAGLPAGHLLGAFFSTWAAWDWRDPITLTPPTTPPTSAPVTVMTPTDPVRNCAGHMSEGGRDLLTQELYRAWEHTENGHPFDGLLTPPPMHRRHTAWAVITVRSAGTAEFDATSGRVRGRMLDLLTALTDAGAADAHAWPRPFAATPTSAAYAIGLGRTPPPAAHLAGIARAWTRGLPGVTLDRTDNGSVPSLP